MTSDLDSKFGKIFVFCIVMGSLKSNKIEITAYNFENIVKTSRFSLWERDNCTQNQKHALVLSTGHVLYHESFKIQLNYCMFQAAYTVSGLKKSTWWYDAVFIQENSQLIPTYYPLTSKACSKLLQGISVNIPGFGIEKFSFETTLLRKLQEPKTEIKIKTKIGSAFMKGGNNKGVKFSYQVAWRTPSKKNITGSVVNSAEVTLGKMNAEMLQSEKVSNIMFLDPFGNQQFHRWNQDRFELDYIEYSIQKGNVTKSFNLAGFSEENTAELIAVGNHHNVMGETTDKWKFVIQVLSEEIRINHLVVNKTNHQNVFFYQFSLDINAQQTTYTVNTQDVSRSGLDALFVQEFYSLHAIVDEMSNLRCRMIDKFIDKTYWL